MSKRRKKNVETTNTMSRMDENIESIAHNSAETNNNVAELVKNSKSKLPIIIAIITLFFTISGVSVYGIIKDFVPNLKPQYELYLSSEYYTLEVNSNTDILATVNFDARSISIAGYLDSTRDGQILDMKQNSQYEWHRKVSFEHTGVYRVVATATAPDGEIIEGYVEIEVIPAGSNIINQLFEGLN